jgi:succinate dehydrogenase / fumarate reductase, cytochrome b subunit
MCFSVLKSSIGKKQVVAVTGVMLIMYLVLHLAGNLLIYLGPSTFNHYAKTLAGLRPWLYVIEVALFLVFITHIYVTVLLVLENIRAAGGRLTRYHAAGSKGERSWATRMRTYTGLFILVFVVWHVFDFTLIDHDGARSIIGGKSYGLYGVVYNSFLNPVHSILYIIAMLCIGFHLAHGVQSCVQTFGYNHPKYSPLIKKTGNWFGFLIAVGFSSIPLYVLINGAR